MPRTFTLAQLRQRVRELVDIEGNRHFTDSEVNSRISSAYAKYYAKLVASGLGYAGEKTQTIFTVGTNTYAMPTDHMSTLRVDYRYSTELWQELEEVLVQEINRYQTTGSQAFGFRLVGGNILLYPTPPSGQTYRHIYVPAPADLTTDTQTVDGVAGFEDAVVLDAAIRCLIKKEDADTSSLLRERDLVDARIQEEAEMRLLTKSRRIARTRNRLDRDIDAADRFPWFGGEDS